MDGRKIYIIGIEGAGTSALAVLYKRLGANVSGSDPGDGFYADALKQENIPVTRKFSVDNIPIDTDLVVYSTAFENGIEVTRSRERNLPTLSYAEAVAQLFNAAYGLAVCGTHGKTTTSAMLAHVLTECGLDPMAVIGARVRDWNGNTRYGEGKYFVLEADEYQNKLRYYDPLGVILTSADWDHPDFFPDERSYREVFKDFVARIPKHGVLVSCYDTIAVADIASIAECQKSTYGFIEGADYHIVDYVPIESEPSFIEAPRSEKQTFGLIRDGDSLGTFTLCLAGRHNAQNAAAVIAIADFLRIDIEAVRVALTTFNGTARRFEYIGEYCGALVYDDYAHHPEEVRATLSAFRELYPNRRLTVVFHPHTFSRTKALLAEFTQSFDDADRVILLDIYGSAREERGSVSSADVVVGINRLYPNRAEHIPDFGLVIEMLKKNLGRNDVLITLGAGDVWKIAHTLARKQTEK